MNEWLPVQMGRELRAGGVRSGWWAPRSPWSRGVCVRPTASRAGPILRPAHPRPHTPGPSRSLSPKAPCQVCSALSSRARLRGGGHGLGLWGDHRTPRPHAAEPSALLALGMEAAAALVPSLPWRPGAQGPAEAQQQQLPPRVWSAFPLGLNKVSRGEKLYLLSP